MIPLKKIFFAGLLIGSFSACKKAYEPQVLKELNQFLVVNGVINTAVNGQTHINLSRTRNLQDTVVLHPETAASITIEGEGGISFPVPAVNDSGDYISGPLNLNPAAKYRLNIITTEGSKYQSAFVESIQTPPIDSVSWQQPYDIDFFVSTHDPTGQARFYRWDFVETWEYRAQLETPWHIENNNLVSVADASNQTTTCWISAFSKNILLGNSAALSEDRISMMPLHHIPLPDQRINERYSLLVNQYALTDEAYNYWQIVKKNSQELGTLFDQLPSQLSGNLVCLDRPAEPVLGYISATAVQSLRIFVRRRELVDWPVTLPGDECEIREFYYDRNLFPVWTYPDPGFSIWYFVSMGPAMMARNKCLDCRIAGGYNQKPSFW